MSDALPDMARSPKGLQIVLPDLTWAQVDKDLVNLRALFKRLAANARGRATAARGGGDLIKAQRYQAVAQAYTAAAKEVETCIWPF